MDKVIDMAAKKSHRKATTAPLTVSRTELKKGGSDDLFREFIHNFLAFSERVQAVRTGFADFIGLSGIQYTVLVSIAHLEQRQDVSVKGIAQHLHLSGAFLTTVTNQLEKLGLIRKSKDTGDRRKLCIVTTAKGRKLLETLAPVQQQVNDQLFESLSGKEFQQLAAQMAGLVDCGDRAVALLNYLKQGQALR